RPGAGAREPLEVEPAVLEEAIEHAPGVCAVRTAALQGEIDPWRRAGAHAADATTLHCNKRRQLPRPFPRSGAAARAGFRSYDGRNTVTSHATEDFAMNSFDARSTLRVGQQEYEIYRLDALAKAGIDISRLPYSLRILLENQLRTEDGVSVTREDILALANWRGDSVPQREISFMPARVLLQDFTGVPAVVDLAAMRDAMADLGGDPSKINPLQPVELVIDHSVQVDAFASPDAFHINERLDYERNRERYGFLKWGQKAFHNFKVVPPNTGICHQVNLEYLARVVFGAGEPTPAG